MSAAAKCYWMVRSASSGAFNPCGKDTTDDDLCETHRQELKQAALANLRDCHNTLRAAEQALAALTTETTDA